MNIVITMGGLGKRFRDAGWNLPKYQIEAKGRTLFEWALLSLAYFKNEKHIFLVRGEDGAVAFIREKCAGLGIDDINVVELDHLTRGQAETALMAKKVWQAKDGILVYNIDTYVEPGILGADSIVADGCIPCFTAPGSHWSFVKINNQGIATEVREKNRISDHCSIGAYYFRSCNLYERMYDEFYCDKSNMEKGEQYIAPMYNLLIKQEGRVVIQDIPTEKVHVLGTPEELNAFMKR